MGFNGDVADIDNEVDAADFDMDDNDYYATDATLVSQDRIRLEWNRPGSCLSWKGNETNKIGTGISYEPSVLGNSTTLGRKYRYRMLPLRRIPGKPAFDDFDR
jgi:hypothetical protein